MAKAVWNGEINRGKRRLRTGRGKRLLPARERQARIPEAFQCDVPLPVEGGRKLLHTISVNGEENADAAWYYPAPYDKAAHIKDHVAFWKGVQVGAMSERGGGDLDLSLSMIAEASRVFQDCWHIIGSAAGQLAGADVGAIKRH